MDAIYGFIISIYMNIPECVFSNIHDVEWMCKLCSSFQYFLIILLIIFTII